MIAAIAIGLPAGSAVGVAAQSEEAIPGAGSAALVSGTWDGGENEDYVITDTDAVSRESWQATGHVEMTDPRLTGDVTLTLDADRFAVADDADLAWGTVRIENDGGVWVGTHIGTIDVLAGGQGITYIELVSRATDV